MDPAVVVQRAVVVPLGWHEGDPISLQFSVRAKDGSPLDWSGPYQLQVRVEQDKTSRLLGTLTMTGTVDGNVTRFTIVGTLAQSAGIPKGTWHYDAQRVDGITRFMGPVYVTAEVTGG